MRTSASRVEVSAESIGHDLSRGVTIFKKNTEQLEQTALERERAMAAAGREPLPDDRRTAERSSSDRSSKKSYPAEGEHDSGISYQAELEPGSEGAQDAGHEEAFDEDEARQMLAQADESAESVSVPA